MQPPSVLIGRYLTDSGIKTSFLHIGDIINGTAVTTEGVILQNLGDKTFELPVCVLLVVMVHQ